jgi:hypothetical protein
MKTLLLLLLTSAFLLASQYSYRKYSHVKKFYHDITPIVLEIAKKYQLPPAAILAISGLESGYGRGYVSQITGNILSLGAYKSDFELPSLYLPWCDSKKSVVYDKEEIQMCSKNELHYKQRPKSLKRDYRPTPYAGTTKKLAYLKYHDKQRVQAHKNCFEDFATRWIRKNSTIKAFSNARIWLDDLIKKEGVHALYLRSTNVKFINTIGGVPHSFNYRKEWPIKVIRIMDKTGLVTLSRSMSLDNENFIDTWKK